MRLLDLLKADVQRNRQLLYGSLQPVTFFKSIFVLLSPRMLPVLLIRLGYASQACGLWPLAKCFSLLNFFLFGIEVASRCEIGPGLFLPHTHGTVIGAVSIGCNAVIYQGVTLGAKDIDFTFAASHRPTVADDVYIGAGAKVLGGISLGRGAKVGANAVVLTSVPDNYAAVGVPAKTFKLER